MKNQTLNTKKDGCISHPFSYKSLLQKLGCPRCSLTAKLRPRHGGKNSIFTLKSDTGAKYICTGKLPEKPPKKLFECPLLEAIRYKELLNDPFINSQSDIAKKLGISRSRVNQIMALLKLAPDIQRELISFQDLKTISFFSEHRLRYLTSIKDTSKQVAEFNKLKEQIK